MKEKGFTLIELMVIIAIMLIILAFAVSLYQRYIRISRVKEATTVMMNNVKIMERYYSLANTFECKMFFAKKLNTSCINNNEIEAIFESNSSINKYYTISIKIDKDYNNYHIIARPIDNIYSRKILLNEYLNIIYYSLSNNYAECTYEGINQSLSDSQIISGCKVQ